jgi:hypothetical protein
LQRAPLWQIVASLQNHACVGNVKNVYAVSTEYANAFETVKHFGINKFSDGNEKAKNQEV